MVPVLDHQRAMGKLNVVRLVNAVSNGDLWQTKALIEEQHVDINVHDDVQYHITKCTHAVATADRSCPLGAHH